MKNISPYFILILLIIVLIVGVIECRGQDQDTTRMFCAPFWLMRNEIENSSKKIEQDTLIAEQQAEIAKQKADYSKLQRDYSEYRKNSERITETRQMLTDGLARQAEHWQKEAARNDRKWKWGRWAIPVGVVVGVLVGK